MADERAKELRRNMTKAERLLWHHLSGPRSAGLAFRRQHKIGDYYVDFFCSKAKMVIEVYGWSHDTTGHYDEKREAWLRNEGYGILRVTNQEVLRDPVAVARAVFDTCKLAAASKEFRYRASSEEPEDLL